MTSVKFFHSAMAGAPQIAATANVRKFGLVLDACLVNGFGQQTATSLVVTGGVATLTLPGTPFEIDAVILVEGSSIAALNGEKRVTGVGGTTNTFDATGVPNGAASGTVTVKYAPAGWSKPFASGATDVFRSNDETGTRFFYRIDGTNNAFDTVTGYENMTAVSSGSGSFHNGGQGMGGSIFPCNNVTNAASAWIVIADGKTVYWHSTLNAATGHVGGFGDFTSVMSVDQYRAFNAGSASTSTNYTTPGTNGTYDLGYVSQNGLSSVIVARAASGVSGSVQVNTGIESFYSGTAGESGALGGAMAPVYPNTPNQGLILSRRVLADAAGVRGFLRGFYLSPQNCHASFQRGDRVVGQGSFAGRKLMALKCGSNAATTSQGVVFIDITGPWA